jgi:hypothetical protein
MKEGKRERKEEKKDGWGRKFKRTEDNTIENLLKEFIEILQVYSLEYYFILLFWLLE